MSRLIVKNLPANVNAEKLKEKFSNKGDVTDVQLRFTPDGKFRKFAFIGFKTDEQAADAIEHFNNTFFNTSRIKVELCSDLGSVDKPRSWSKHTKKSNEETPLPQVKVLKKRENKKDKRSVADEELLKKVGQHKDEPHFREFLEVHSAEKVLGLCERDSGVEESDPEDEEKETEDDKPDLSLAHASVSDSEYLKSKMKGNRPPIKLVDEKSEEVKKLKLFTVKVKNLPKEVKKHEIKELFKPVSVASIRKARGLLGIAYVGFKTEKDMRRALIKNKSFMKGKQVGVSECKVSADGEPQVPDKWKRQESGLTGQETIGESGRIFLRNLCYTVKEEELEQLFSKFGPVSEINLPLDKLTRKLKGYGTVTYLFPEHAVAAYAALDGTSFQGRMLHLLPAKSIDEERSSDSTNYKKLKEARLKKTAGLSHNWNTLFLGANAVANVIADTYKASKQEVLTGKEGAVRLALGETQLVAATREFLLENGIHLDAFNAPSEKRSKNIILVKNLPANTAVDEIREKFEKFGVLGRVVLPPSGIMAVVEFEEPSEARSSFTKLAYTKFKNLPLYLEWAPQNTFIDKIKKEINENANADSNEELAVNAPGKIEESSDEEMEPEPDTTLYVKNLSFDTTEDQLKRHFETCGKLASVTISRKRDVKNPGKMLSLGYGFVQYILRSSVNKALAELQGSELSGHSLELKRSDRTTKPVSVFSRKVTDTKKQTGAKILVKNVPFQANVTEIQRLFGTFGQLKFVRMPKKMAGTGRHRGFCFVEFSTKHEAKAAMKALCQSTHLYGRRLVLEWAAPDDTEIDVIRKRTAQHFHREDVPATKKSNKAVADFDIDEEEQDDDV